MPQITTITSEALQATIRRLLPSQRGFGIDLEASNVITPVIDITATAEGSQLPDYLQQAYSHGSQNTVYVANGTSNFAVTAGFYRITGSVSVMGDTAGARFASLKINDGSTDKTFWGVQLEAGGINGEYVVTPFDLYAYFNSGDSLNVAASVNCRVFGSYRQIADVYGNLINPSGFTFE